MKGVVPHRDEVIPFRVEPHSLIKGTLFVRGPDGPETPNHIGIVCDQIVGTDAYQGACRAALRCISQSAFG